MTTCQSNLCAGDRPACGRVGAGAAAPFAPRRGVLRRAALGAVALGFLAPGAFASERLVVRGEGFVVSNETAATEATNLSLAYGSLGIDKVGAGAYTLPRGQVYSPDPVVVRALEGEVGVSAEGAFPAPVEPTEALSLASFWLDAAVNLQTNANGEISYWYDRRETKTGETWGTSRARAKTNTSPKDKNEAVYAPVMPRAATPEGMSLPMVDFGRYQKGTGMNFVTADSSSAQSYDSIRDVYVVANFQHGYGYPIGSSGTVMLHPTAFGSESLDSYYNSGDAHPYATAGEFLVNGARCNPLHTKVRPGLQLIEIHATCDMPIGGFSRIFDDRSIAGRYGGDFIGEVLVFNGEKAALTDAERRQVSRYLMAKWGIAPDAGTPTVSLGETASLRTTEVEANVSGRGTVERSGTETAHYRSTAGCPATGVKVHLAAGTMQADVREVNLSVKSGEALSFATGRYGVHTVTAGAAGEGEASVTGVSEEVRLGRIDAGVTNMTVSAKSVVLGDAVLGGGRLASGYGTATVANGSFESAFSAADWVWDTKNGSSDIKAFTSEASVLDWRLAGGGTDPDKFKATYRLSRFMPSDGTRALLLKQDNLFHGHVSVSRDGDYVLSFDGTGRMWYDHMQLKLSLVDAAGATNTFATCSIAIEAGLHPYRFLVNGLKAGDYLLVIAATSLHTYNDSHAMLDNFRMSYVSDGLSAVGGVAVPNGSFENTRITSRTRGVTAFGTNDIECAGWTLTSPDAPAKGAVAPVSRYMTQYYAPGERNVGLWQLRFHGNTGRATSAEFSLPAGKWSLRCKAAKWTYDAVKWNGVGGARSYDPVLAAKATVNGSPAWEGSTESLTSYDMKTVAFTGELTVTETDRIVLELRETATYGYVNVDDLEFVPVGTWGSTAELVKDGSFNNDAAWWSRSTGTKRNIYVKALNGGYELHYGGQRCDGAMAVCIVNSAGLAQDITFPAAGAYRLSFWTRSRVSHYGNEPNSSDYGGNALRASLIVDGVTNTIVETPPVYSTNFNQTVALFTVPAAGKHRLYLAGVNDPNTGVWTGGSKDDANILLDLVSVTAAPDGGAAPNLPENLSLKLKDGSKLRLDYVGEASVHRLKIGTKRYHGRVDASVAPGVVTGPGVLNVTEPKPGLTVIVR